MYNWLRRGCMLIMIVLSLSGCSSKPNLAEQGPEQAYRYLERRFEKGNYLDAANGLDFFTLNYSGSSLVDSAQFLLGRAHFEMKEFLIAANAFDELSRRFPSSPLVAESMYMIGLCYWELSPKFSLDQEYTLKAIEALQSFIDFYPENESRIQEAQELIAVCREKLAHKEYSSAMIYLKMRDYPSAQIYFQWILDLFYDTEWAPKAAFQLGMVHSLEHNNDEAAAAFRYFLFKYPDHSWRTKAETSLEKLKSEIEG